MKKITERLFYISLEDAETMMREPAVGREKYNGDNIVEQHGSITNIYVDFPITYDDKGNIIKEETPIMGTIQEKKEGTKISRVAVPEPIKETPSVVEENKNVAQEEIHKKKRRTKGDKISEFEGENGLLNNINKDYL